jgi:DUF1365 family protein
MSLRSAAYTGLVVHARQRPKAHRLRYRVFYLLLDIDELPEVARRSRLFAHNRRAPFTFHDRDHGARDGSPLRPWVDAQLAAAGITVSAMRISILCMPRILGYVFNPLSVYFCRDAEDRVVAVLYEVANTFGESHTYVVRIDGDKGRVLRHGFDKAFYVSPFIPMACRYEMAIRPPGKVVSIAIREEDADGPLLAATFHGRYTRLNDRFLVSTLVRYPLLTLKVVAGIHWDALQLWFKRVPMFRHTTAPKTAVSVVPRQSGLTNV